MIRQVQSAGGVTVSYSQYGDGPPLVLVHGAFSNEFTNWEFVQPFLRQQFTVYAVARRGRGGTDTTRGHTIEQEAMDVLTVIGQIQDPVFLLGHSYGAHCALAAAGHPACRVAKLVLYEPPLPGVVSPGVLRTLEALAADGDWDAMASTFFQTILRVPAAEIDSLRSSGLWAPIVADAEASLEDLRSLQRYEFVPDRFRTLAMPVLLQMGSESPSDLWVTGALENVLPNVRTEELPGQAHEGMTTAPEMYAESVARFLLGSPPS